MSVSDEEEEDYGFGSEDEPSSDMEMDDSTEYGFDPAEDIDISSRRVSYHACRDVPRRDTQLRSTVFWECAAVLAGCPAAICSCKHHVKLCRTCNTPLHYLLKVSRVACHHGLFLVRTGCL